ncbi:hypothetical protein WJX72_010304 [[Myrmecia] bisecta]|uniref:Isocitrate lyase n=1 Tax=[Myrmecia] bisecta TaxID=41462 RepID=A0AAW1QSK9_9CHLO
MATCVTALPHFCNRAGSNWSAERQGRPQRLTAVRSRERHAIVIVTASAVHSSRAATLRRLLEQPGILKGPCCHDGLSARLIEQAGFPIAFMSGFCVSAARLGAPDTGLISYQEMVDQGRYMHEATQHLPIIGDGDTGYGNAMNVKRTVRGYAASGFAGILIEDQVAPKSCGHVKGKHVVSREEAVSRIRAAVDAREEGSDIVIVARTDARQALSLEEALWRAAAFADAGADVVFIDALASREELRAFAGAGQGLKGIPKMANMLEGGGKTPILSPEELEALGFKLVAYPLSLLGVSIQAMQSALQLLQQGQVPGEPALPSFSAIQTAIGFDASSADDWRLPNEDFRKGRFLRLKVTDRTTGDVKIDTRFPAGFLDNLASFVPAVAGVDLEGLIKNAKGDASWTAAKPVADFSSNSDVIQIFLE